MPPADLEKLKTALATPPRTTAQLAIACKWSLDEAFKNLVELESQGIVARVSDRSVNSSAAQWRLASAAEPDAPADPAWAASADAPTSVPRSTKHAAGDPNPYEAPARPSSPPTEDPEALERQKRFEAKGHFWLGFAAGLFLGPIAYLLTTSSAPRTNKGASWGAFTLIMLFIAWRLLLALLG